MSIHLHKNDLPSNVDLGNSIAVDTETMGLNILRDRLCLVQLSSGNGEAHIVQLEAQNYNAPNLKKLINDKNILKIFHYARFDMASLKHYLQVEVNNVYCTKIASKLSRTYTESHGLKALCDELLNVELSKKQQTSDWGKKDLTQKQLEYAASDVLYLHQIKEILDIRLQRESRENMFKECINFLPTRVKLDLEGFYTMNPFSH